VAHRIADTVLCLPIYPDLTDAMVHRIADLVVSA
jgi:dTDP-4-amino-4,6-dideoxygalactose transaminase